MSAEKNKPSQEDLRKMVEKAKAYVASTGSPVEVAAVLTSTVKVDDQPKSYTSGS